MVKYSMLVTSEFFIDEKELEKFTAAAHKAIFVIQSGMIKKTSWAGKPYKVTIVKRDFFVGGGRQRLTSTFRVRKCQERTEFSFTHRNHCNWLNLLVGQVC